MVTEQLIPDLLPVADDWDISAVQILAFDLDDTLAPSKTQVPAPIADALVACLAHWQVCIISGGRFEQFQHQVLDHLVAPDALLDRLHLMPTCGTQYYRWGDPGWTKLYSEDLSQEQKDQIVAALTTGAHELGLWQTTTWGDQVEDRGSQVTFSALGQAAPVAAKTAWDPTGEKRSKLRSYAADRLPGLEVRSGGSTSIDVTRAGIDKAYGITKLLAHTGTGPDDLLFVGDRLDVGGNDYPVRTLGIRCVQVTGWEQTADLLGRLLRRSEVQE